MAELSVVAAGVYWVRPSFRAMREALLCQGDSATVRAQLGSLVLVELEVRGVGQPLDLGQLHQPGNENVPYDEVYFSLDRRTVLARALEHPSSRDFAVAFYLHAFDVGSPLEAPWGQLELPEPQWQRPEHLAGLEYEYFD
jgi:hypothetical protein